MTATHAELLLLAAALLAWPFIWRTAYYFGFKKGASVMCLSPEARAALEAGLESARRREIKPWGDQYK